MAPPRVSSYNAGVDSWSVGFGEGDPERLLGVEAGRSWTPVPLGRKEGQPPPAPSRATIKLRVVADYICPWCYIGSARAYRIAQELAIQLEPWPYELLPYLPKEGLPREVALGRHYPEAYLRRLQDEAASDGLTFQVPLRVPNTHLAHEAVQFALEKGRGWEMHRALYEAYWARGEDIGEAQVLVTIAHRLGLDGRELDEALSQGRYHHVVEEKIAWAQAQGIAGVPTFLFGDTGFALVGAQDFQTFRLVAQRVIERTKP